MSVQAISWVLDHSRARGHARLVLIAIANHATDRGKAFPSVATIAQEAGISVRTVQRHLRHLVTLKEVRLEERFEHGRPSTWLYIMPALEGRQSDTPVKESPPSGRHPRQSVRGDTRVTGGVTTVSPEPSLNQKQETPNGVSTGRPRDLIFEALCEICGWDYHELTKNERGRVAAAKGQLAEVKGATPDEIRRRAGIYRLTFEGAALTPQALVSNWNACRYPPQNRGEARRQAERAVDINRRRV